MRAAHSITSSGSSPGSQAAPTRAAGAADRDAVETATERCDGLLMLEQLGLV